MQKVLLVSPYPFSKTGRGMDVLTECFKEEEWSVEHLKFPSVFYSVKTDYNDNKVKQIISKKALLPYVDGFMFWFPQWLFSLMVKYQAKKAPIDFGQYDYIVLESGKPLFLMDYIPDRVKIIYRQSDSVRHVLGRNKYFIELEDRCLDRAFKVIAVKDVYKKDMPERVQKKVSVIRNGYSIPDNIEYKNPYTNGSKNAVYVGLTKLDIPTLKTIAKNNRNLDIHIFGSCLPLFGKSKIKGVKNIHYYGFQPRQIYLSYIKYADMAIFPFKPWGAMKWVGFTTKFLNYLYFDLPVISYLTGKRKEFKGTGVLFAEDRDDFSHKVEEILNGFKPEPPEIDFNFFSHPERKKEYKTFIRKLNE